MYCGNCGSKRAKKVNFCGGCGRPFPAVETTAASTVAQSEGENLSPLRDEKFKPFRLKALIGLSLVVIASITVTLVFVLGRAPMPSETNAQDFVLSAEDFGDFEVVEDDYKTDVPFEYYGKGCSERQDMVDAVAGAKPYIGVSFSDGSSDTINSYSVGQMILEFDDEQGAIDFLDMVDTGSRDSDCDTHLPSLGLSSVFDPAKTLQKQFGVGEGYYVEHGIDIVGIPRSAQFAGIFARRGNIVMKLEIFVAKHNGEAHEVTLSDLQDIGEVAIRRFMGEGI